MKKKNEPKIWIAPTVFMALIVTAFVVLAVGIIDVTASGPTYVSGFISTNTTWTLADSPYIVIGDVIVEEGVELTIEPGVTVKFDKEKNLVIDGILNARGNDINKIKFTSSATSPALGEWGAINFRETSPDYLSEINWIVVEYGSKGINFEKTPQRIYNSSFSENVYAIFSENVRRHSSQLEIYNVSIFHNTYGIGSAGAYPGTSYISIFSSNIYENTYGIYGPYSGNISISNSKIYNNAHGIFSPWYCNLSIQYSDITNNTYGIQANDLWDVGRSNFDLLIFYSNITHNSGGNGVSISQGAIHCSNIHNNSPYDLKNAGGEIIIINATYNWWGTTNMTLIEQHIYDYYDDYTVGKVIYVPFLTEPVTPENMPPTAIIDSITPDPAEQGTDTVSFTGHGTDSDGSVVAYNWRSSIDGQLSTSASFTRFAFDLSVGTHTIYFKVQDDDGAWSPEDTEDLTINPANQPPTAIIDSITPDPAEQGTDTVSFTGHGTDSDGSVVAYNWRSSIDGQLSTSASFTKSASDLSVGTHTIYFKVQDDDGAWSPEDTEDLTINPVPTSIFDTGSPPNPYPSIMGNHTGAIKSNHTVIATKLYTYPCVGTGGHTEYARIWNLTWNATATWEGYVGDWKNITFDKTVVLLANETYDYTIRTGSYPQIHHKPELPTENGWINCTKFTDANGKVYYDWIPAIRLWA